MANHSNMGQGKERSYLETTDIDSVLGPDERTGIFFIVVQ